MSKKKALEKGKNQGELIRLKQTLRKQNDIIVKSKRKEEGPGTPAGREHERGGPLGTQSTTSKRMDDDNKTSGSKFPSLVLERPKLAVKNLEELRRGPELIRFYVKQKFGADIPFNAKLESYQQGDDQHHKIEKYLKGKSKVDEQGIFLARLYNDFLEENPDLRYTDTLVDKSKQVKSEARSRITEMLNVNTRYKH
jgi:hypothetical protein